MKNFNLWFILALIAIFAMTCASQWNITHSQTAQTNTFYTAPTEHDTVKLADILLYTDRDGVMHFDTNKTKHLHGFTGDSIMFYYGYLFDVGEHNDLRFEMKYSNNWYYGKETTYFYNLYHKGYLLAPSIVSSNILGGQLYQSASGVDRYSDIDVDTTINVSPKIALDLAIEESREILADLGQDKFIWEYADFKNYTPNYDDNYTLNSLHIKKVNNDYRLCYKVRVFISLTPVTAYDFFIDAKNGELISKNSTINFLNCSSYICNDATVPQSNTNVNCHYYNNQNIYTYACGNPTVYKLGQRDDKIKLIYSNPPTSQDEVCWDSSNPPDNVSTAGYFALNKVIDFFQNELGISYGTSQGTTPIDTISTLYLFPGNNGASGLLYQATSQQVEIQMFMGRGIANGELADVTIKQIAHEYTHKAIETRGNYLTAGNGVEEFAILEFFCDVVGLKAESEEISSPFSGSSDKWKMQLPNASEFRDFSNPLNSNPIQPKVYNGTNWSPTNGHANSGVPAHWYYLLAEGNAQITGVGINTAFEIAKKTLFYEIKNPALYPQKNFAALRKATLKIAEKYGCNVWESARQAWDAVGVTGSTCEIAVNITTNCPSPSTCSANITTCGGSSTGTRIKISGGGLTSPIKSSTGQLNTTNLVCGNTYTVEVTDKNNPAECVVLKAFTCQDNAMGSINPPCPPSAILTASYNVINNCNDNNIIGSVTGGIPPYTYNWSSGSTSQNLMNVPSGTYSLTVSDAGCNNYQNTFSVDGFVPLNVLGQTQTLCTATDVGAITLNVSGGKTPYTYHWSNGATSQNLSNLSVGSYAVTVTDANGCTKNLSYYIGVSSVTLQNFSTTPSCIYSNDGVINLGVYGGTGPYTYQWQGNGNSQTVQNPRGLRTGQHCVTVTDANGCVNSACYTVPAASYSYIDDLGNCERIYTCNGQTYAKDMLDYANIDRDFENCVGEIPCKIQGGTPEIVQGQVLGYQIDGGFLGKNPHCEQTCKIHGQIGYAAAPDGITFTVVDGTCGGVTTGNQIMGGVNYQVWCDGVYYGDFCDDPDITIVIGGATIPPRPRVQNPNVTTYPNPFNQYLNLKFDDISDEVTIRLTNILGQEIERHVYNINEGENIIAIKFNENLANGVYLIQLEFSDGTVMTKKLIHQH